jgi:hypothetical protein
VQHGSEKIRDGSYGVSSPIFICYKDTDETSDGTKEELF